MKVVDIQMNGNSFFCYHDDTFMVFDAEKILYSKDKDDVVGSCWPAGKKLEDPIQVPTSNITRGSGWTNIFLKEVFEQARENLKEIPVQ